MSDLSNVKAGYEVFINKAEKLLDQLIEHFGE